MKSEIKTKKFNLNDWKCGAKACLPGGGEIEQLTYFQNLSFGKPSRYPLMGIVNGKMKYWDEEGNGAYPTNHHLPLMLVEDDIPDMWVNIYENKFGYYFLSDIHKSKKSAKSSAEDAIGNKHVGIFKLIKEL